MVINKIDLSSWNLYSNKSVKITTKYLFINVNPAKKGKCRRLYKILLWGKVREVPYPVVNLRDIILSIKVTLFKGPWVAQMVKIQNLDFN